MGSWGHPAMVTQAAAWKRGEKTCLFLKASTMLNPFYHPVLTDTALIFRISDCGMRILGSGRYGFWSIIAYCFDRYGHKLDKKIAFWRFFFFLKSKCHFDAIYKGATIRPRLNRLRVEQGKQGNPLLGESHWTVSQSHLSTIGGAKLASPIIRFFFRRLMIFWCRRPKHGIRLTC